MKMIRVHVMVYGNVQGVFFRENTVEKARSLGIKGWIRNINDDVEAVFEGSEYKINEIVQWCHVGPEAADVDYVKVDYQEYTGEFDSFERR